MTVYTKLTISGVEYNDFTKCTLSKSIGENDATSRLELNFDNFCAIHTDDFSTADELDFWAGNVPTGSLDHYYTFKANANDEVGTVNGTVSGATLVGGVIDNSYSFNGSDSFISFDNDWMPQGQANDMSIFAQIKPNVLSGNRPIITQRGTEDEGNFLFMQESGALTFKWWEGAGDTGSTWTATSTGLNLVTGNFQNVGLTFDHSEKNVSFFREGSKESITMTSGTNSNYLGREIGRSYTQLGDDGRALLFNGATNYVPTSSVPDIADEFTISTWVKINLASNSTIIYVGNVGTGVREFFDINYSNNEDGYQIGWDLEGGGGTNVLKTSGTPTGIGNWHHLAYTHKKNDYGRVYFDDVLLGSATIDNANIKTTSVASNLGTNNNWLTGVKQDYLNGTLDEFNIWDKVLGSGEISDLYNSGTGLYVNKNLDFNSTGSRIGSNLILNYHFDESGTTTTATDTSDVGNNGSLVNFPVSGMWVNGFLDKPTVSNNFDGNIDELSIYSKKITTNESDIIYNKGTSTTTKKLFSGLVTKEVLNGKPADKNTLKLTGRDWTNLLQKVTVKPEVYTSQEISTIVIDLMTKYGPSDFTTNNVQVTGITLDRISFSRIKLFDAVKQLADLANDFFFFVDEDKDLHFKQKSQINSNVLLDNTNVLKSKFTEDAESIFNQVTVYGGKQLVSHPQESFVADGTGSVFTLEANPSNTKVVSSGINQVGNIFGVSTSVPSGTNYLVNFYDKQVVFVSGTEIGYSSIPTSGTVITVDYDDRKPIIKQADDNDSINTYRLRTKEIIDDSIEDPKTAADIAINQVALNKDPKIRGKLEVQDVILMNPGEICNVNLPNEGHTNEPFDIIENKYEFTSKKNFKDQVLTVKVGQRTTDVNDVLKELLINQRRLQAGNIDTTGILSRLQTSKDAFGLKVKSWSVASQGVGDSFILDDTVNGIIGSPQVGRLGGQLQIGSLSAGSITVIISGGDI